MKRDKALIDYHGEPHAKYIYEVLNSFCEKSFISAQPGQWTGTPLANLPTIEDRPEENAAGPIAGILAAFVTNPDANWLIVACDLVHFSGDIAKILIDQCDESAVATCFANTEKNFPEALCAIYTPHAQKVFREAIADDIRCPVKVLGNSNIRMLAPSGPVNLANINTPQEFAEVHH